MNRRLALQIIDCLRVVGPAESDFDDLKTWDRRSWLAMLPWLHTSGLALYLLRTLRDRCQEDLMPPDVRRRLEFDQASNERRVAVMAGEFATLNRCFENAGIRYAALKGFALIPDYSPDASLRAQADFDYLVAPESKSQAEQALRAAGYLRRFRDDRNVHVFFHSARPLRIPASDDDLYCADLPRRLELHTGLWDGSPESIHPRSLGTALERTQLRPWQGLRFPALADEDALTFQILHTLRHIFDFWCRLALLLEIAYFLQRRAHDEVFWRRFVARAEGDSGLPQATGVVFTLAAELFGASVPAALTDWIRQSTPRAMALWVARYGRGCALENFMGDKFSLFLHREFIPDAAAWRVVCRRRLFPFHRPNRAAEPASPRISSRLAAGLRQWLHVSRRVKFHFASALRYGWELPRWERMLREASAREAYRGDPTTVPIAAAVPVRPGER